MKKESVRLVLLFDPSESTDFSFDQKIACFNSVANDLCQIKFFMTDEMKHIPFEKNIVLHNQSQTLTNGNENLQLTYRITDTDSDIRTLQSIRIAFDNNEKFSGLLENFIKKIILFTDFKHAYLRSNIDNYVPTFHTDFKDDRQIKYSDKLPLIAHLYAHGIAQIDRPECFYRINIWSSYICNQVDFIPEKHASLFEIAELLENGAWWLQLTIDPLDVEIPEHLARLRAAYEALPKVGGRDLLIDLGK
ncbi:MAG: DUF5953 family protein [Bacteroidia bacterium]